MDLMKKTGKKEDSVACRRVVPTRSCPTYFGGLLELFQSFPKACEIEHSVVFEHFETLIALESSGS